MACPSRASRDSTALASAPSSRDVPRASNTASRRRRRPCSRQSSVAGRSEGLLAHTTSASFMRASRAGPADVRHDRTLGLRRAFADQIFERPERTEAQLGARDARRRLVRETVFVEESAGLRDCGRRQAQAAQRARRAGLRLSVIAF
jgi:hypothetical protein